MEEEYMVIEVDPFGKFTWLSVTNSKEKAIEIAKERQEGLALEDAVVVVPVIYFFQKL